MKIVLVVDQFDNSNNGTTITARRYAEQLRAHGHKVVVVACGDPMPDKIAAPKHNIPVFQKLIESQGMQFAKPDDKLFYEAFKGADIVHFYLPFKFCRRGEDIARQMGLPTVAAFHTQPENITSSIGLGKCKAVNDFLYSWDYRVFYNRFHHIHCPSQFIADELKAHGYDADCRVISNGVADIFRPRDVQKPKSFRDKFTVLMIGRLSVEKRQDLIIEAAKLSKYSDKIQLVFAGKGPKKSDYERQGAKLKNKPIFGFYTSDELVDLCNSCDLYVHASDAEIEGISCMEAMACGMVPVISNSRLSATAQFALDDRSVFEAGSAKDLAAKMDYWIEHPEERTEMSSQYAAQGDTMRVDECVRKAEQMYIDAIAEFNRVGYKSYDKRLIKHLSPNPEKVLKKQCKGSWLRRKLQHGFIYLITPLLAFINKVFLGLEIEGVRNVRGLKGGAVTVCNHVHGMDCTIVRLALLRRQLYVVSLESNFKMHFVGWLIKALGAVPVPEDRSKMLKFQRGMEQIIKRGDWVHYYPEGMLLSRYPTLREFHIGAFYTAARADCPVVPMVITYRRPGWFRSIFSSKPTLCIKVGHPIYACKQMPVRQAADLMCAQSREEMERMMNDGDKRAVVCSEEMEEGYIRN